MGTPSDDVTAIVFRANSSLLPLATFLRVMSFLPGLSGGVTLVTAAAQTFLQT